MIVDLSCQLVVILYGKRWINKDNEVRQAPLVVQGHIDDATWDFKQHVD